MKNKFKKIIPALILFSFLVVGTVQAREFEIKNNPDQAVAEDIVFGPAKVELFLAPGEEDEKVLEIFNRSGEEVSVKVEVEDFAGDENHLVKLLGDKKGSHSLKNYLEPAEEEFVLIHGQKAFLPIKISIPSNAEPGGLYGAVAVSVDKNRKSSAPIATVSRFSSLFFVRIEGDIEESGYVEGFSADKNFYNQGPVEFSFVYKNEGNVHLNPYGRIDIKNIFGKKIKSLEIRPTFVMPGFSRETELIWNENPLGFYTAELLLNKGYNGQIEEKKIYFGGAPLNLSIGSAIALVLFVIVFILFFKKFELKKKNKPENYEK